jgi:hypothetical protein
MQDATALLLTCVHGGQVGRIGSVAAVSIHAQYEEPLLDSISHLHIPKPAFP